MKDRYVDEKDKRKAAFALDRQIKDMTYTHSLQGPLKYFEDLNDKFLRLEHLKFLKISDDDDKKTIAEHAFEQTVPPIAMNEINAKWKQKPEDEQTWAHYKEFWTDELPAAFQDHGVKEQQLASRMRAMEANIDGIRSEQQGIRTEQQTIQNDFHNFGQEAINSFSADTGSIAGASQGEASSIAQLQASMAKQQADMAKIMAALGNQPTTPAPSPSPELLPTQQTAPTTGTNGIDTTLTDPDYKDNKNRGGGTANHKKRWRQYRSYCPGKGINLKCNGTKCKTFDNKCPDYPDSQKGATYQDRKGGSNALEHRWMTYIGPDGLWWKKKEDYYMFYNGPNGARS